MPKRARPSGAAQSRKTNVTYVAARGVSEPSSVRYVLNDVWFVSADNMKYIKTTLKKDFIMPLKSNRKVALSENSNRGGRYVAVGTLGLPANTTCQV